MRFLGHFFLNYLQLILKIIMWLFFLFCQRCLGLLLYGICSAMCHVIWTRMEYPVGQVF